MDALEVLRVLYPFASDAQLFVLLAALEDWAMKGVMDAAPKRPESCVTILHRNTYLYVVPKGHRVIAGATRRATRGELQDLAEAFRPVRKSR